MTCPERPQRPSTMVDHPTLIEPESFSDSDWLDISSTDRESDDNDSMFSSRRSTDHERHSSRSRSRRSSVSDTSSRNGDVDVWEGMADDSADDERLDAVQPLALASPSAHQDIHFASPHRVDTSPEELRVNEGLDQSMVSTLSSSRPSSLHASTVHNSLRDLRLSFPDPITSSREELATSSYEDIAVPDTTRSATDSYVTPVPWQNRDLELESASEVTPTLSLRPTQCTSDFNVILYGLSTPSKWSLVDTLLGKAVQGAGFTIATTLDDSEGPIRQLTVLGHPKSNNPFPHIITVTDKTTQDLHTIEDPSLMSFTKFSPLAIVYMPSCPPRLSEPACYLPVLATPSSVDLTGFRENTCASVQGTWDMFNVPRHRVMCLTQGHSAVVDKRVIDELDPSSAYRAFSTMWTSNRRGANRISINGTHALTIIAILSLFFGVVVRSMHPSGTRVLTPATIAVPNSCSSIWQLLRPTGERPKQVVQRAAESLSVATTISMQNFALSVFTAESTAVALASTQALPHTSKFRRTMPSTLHERFMQSKDLILRPALSVLALESQPSKVVAPSATTSHHLDPASASPSFALTQTSAHDILKEYLPVASAVIMNDVHALMDALDALMQAISKQVCTLMVETAALVQWSMSHLEKSAETLECIKDALHARNARAKKRAKELKERGTKWLFEAGEVVARRADISQGNAKVLAEEIANRARRARSNAKKMAEEVQERMQEQEKLVFRAWDMGEKQWKLWQKRVGKGCKSKRSLKGAAFC